MKTPVELYQTLFPQQDALDTINHLVGANFNHVTLILSPLPDTALWLVEHMDAADTQGKSQWRCETELTLSRTDFLVLLSPEMWNEELLHQYLQKMRTLNPYLHVWMFGAWDNYYDDDFEISIL